MKTPIIYLTANDLYNINEEVTGMLPYVRDRHLLLSAVKRPQLSLFDEPQFPTLHDKAAALLESLAYHHLFADGNKRTALRAVTLFLEVNGWRAAWSDEEEYAYILEVAQGRHTVQDIAAWLRAHTAPR
jgi:death-on-curing protein